MAEWRQSIAAIDDDDELRVRYDALLLPLLLRGCGSRSWRSKEAIIFVWVIFFWPNLHICTYQCVCMYVCMYVYHYYYYYLLWEFVTIYGNGNGKSMSEWVSIVRLQISGNFFYPINKFLWQVTIRYKLVCVCVSLWDNRARELCSERLGSLSQKEVRLIIWWTYETHGLRRNWDCLADKHLWDGQRQCFCDCRSFNIGCQALCQLITCKSNFIYISSLSNVHITPLSLETFSYHISPWPLEIYMKCYGTYIQVYDYICLVACLFIYVIHVIIILTFHMVVKWQTSMSNRWRTCTLANQWA